MEENTNQEVEVVEEVEPMEELKTNGYLLQHPLKSKVTWMALSALLLFILKTWGILPRLGVDEENFNKLVDLSITAAIALGILNNPSDPHSF